MKCNGWKGKKEREMSRRNKTPRATKIVTAKVTMVEQRNVHSLLANDTRSNNFLARDTPTKDTKSLAAIKSARALSFNCENLVKSRQPIDNRAAKIEVDPSAFSETTRNKVISRSAINIGYFYLLYSTWKWNTWTINFSSTIMRVFTHWNYLHRQIMSIEAIPETVKIRQSICPVYLDIYGANCLANSEHRFNSEPLFSRLARLATKSKSQHSVQINKLGIR